MTVFEEYCDRTKSKKEDDSELFFFKAGLRNLHSFATFVRAQITFGISRRHAARSKEKSTLKMDIDDIEKCLDADEYLNAPVTSVVSVENDDANSLKSPRRYLQSCIPNGASQQVRMDLLLLSESPRRKELEKTAWKGCSASNRAQVWRMLVKHEPLNYTERKGSLAERRRVYQENLKLLRAPDRAVSFSSSGRLKRLSSSNSESETRLKLLSNSYDEQKYENDAADNENSSAHYSNFSVKTLRQIEMDLPRTHPGIPIFHVNEVRSAMRRILYVFGMLNPCKNYVQGMNEILTPILVVFFSDYFKEANEGGVDRFLSRTNLGGALTGQELSDAEADAFWTFSFIVSQVEDNFTSNQLGIRRRVGRLEEIIRIVDPALVEHFAMNGIEFLQFSFRWMNCLLMRELPFGMVIKLWDAYLAEEDGFSDLHVYACAAILTRFSRDLMNMDFEDSLLFLQHLPTVGWDVDDIDELLSQAYVWKQTLKLESLAPERPETKCEEVF